MLPKSPLLWVQGLMEIEIDRLTLLPEVTVDFNLTQPGLPTPPPASWAVSRAPPSHSALPSQLCHLLSLAAGQANFLRLHWGILPQREPGIPSTGSPS